MSLPYHLGYNYTPFPPTGSQSDATGGSATPGGLSATPITEQQPTLQNQSNQSQPLQLQSLQQPQPFYYQNQFPSPQPYTQQGVPQQHQITPSFSQPGSNLDNSDPLSIDENRNAYYNRLAGARLPQGVPTQPLQNPMDSLLGAVPVQQLQQSQPGLPMMYSDPMQVPIDQYPQPVQYQQFPIGYPPYLNSNPRGYQYVQPFMNPVQRQNPPGYQKNFNEMYAEPAVTTHFKPTKPKKNSKPRINKIQKLELPVKKPDQMKRKALMETIGEFSLEDLYQHFQDVLKIEKPKSSPPGLFQLKLKNDLECQLFDLFVNNLSNSIDIFLPQRVFQKIIPELALYDETNMITDSIFCLSALMLQRIRPDKLEHSVPIKYYHQCIKSIRHYLSMPGVEANEGIISRCLLSTILLCIYEMFFVAIDTTYVKGASSLLVSIILKRTNKKNLLKESPFHEICFLAMFICDLILSLKFNLPSMYSIENFWKPLDTEYFESFETYSNNTNDGLRSDDKDNDEDEAKIASNIENSDDEDDKPNFADASPRMEIRDLNFNILPKQSTIWWFHKTFINFSFINDYNNEAEVITKEDFEMNKPFQRYLELKKLVEDYDNSLPSSLNPIIYKPINQERLFPVIYFKDELTAIIGLNAMLSKVALYESLVCKNNTKIPLVIQELNKYPANYAKKISKDIIGIMKTYDGNINVWSNNIHSVRRVAKYIHDEPAEFEEFSNLVNKIIATCHLKLQHTIV